MQRVFDDRRKLMVGILKDVKDIVCIEPKGAFYVFVNVSKLYGRKFDGVEINGSLSFADAALKRGVALIPGIAFGNDECIRLSYAISKEDIVEGLARFISFVNDLK
jgi:aspartate aminotransferase